MEQIKFRWEPDRRVYSVAQLNSSIRGVLNKSFDDIWVAARSPDSSSLPAATHIFR